MSSDPSSLNTAVLLAAYRRGYQMPDGPERVLEFPVGGPGSCWRIRAGTLVKRLVVVLFVVGALGPTSEVRAEVEEAVADHIPWSGYWWPIEKGELLGPLGKYDALTGKRATWWELENHPPGPQAEPWHGYCHGWAAASVLEQEPTRRRAAAMRGVSQVFEVADFKGLYAACHAYDPATKYGDRFGDGENDDPQDMAPDHLWRVLRTFIRDRRMPLIFDLDPAPEVWNYPVFAYRIEYHPRDGAGAQHEGRLKLWAADDSVPPEYVGTMPHVQTYTFEFRMQDQEIVTGSGRWTGPSVQNHPDFAWYPDAVVPENPELKYETVQGLVSGGPPEQPSPRIESPAVRPTPRPTDVPGSGGDYVRAMLREQETRDRAGNVLPKPISPLQLVGAIANQTSHFGFDARLLQFGQVRYKIGDRTAILGSSERAGYLYALHIHPTGELTLLYPAPGQDNAIAARASFHIPPAEQGDYVIRGPVGSHRIKVLVTERPLILTGLNRRGMAVSDRSRPESSGNLVEHGFRFFPTQDKQIKAMLREYVEGKKSLGDGHFDASDVIRTLPRFAQDEIVLYVESDE